MSLGKQVVRWLLVIFFLFMGITGVSAMFQEHLSPFPLLAQLSIGIFGITGLVAAAGLIFNKSWGHLAGYGVAGGICIMFLGEAYNHFFVELKGFTLEDFLWSALFLSCPLLSFLGLRLIRMKPQL